MRPDMAEVLIERPRGGGFPKKAGRPPHGDELPRYESTSRNRGGTKWLSDLLGPLRKYLNRQVGRPWDKVYSEIRQNLAPRRHLDMHILEHLDRMVMRTVDWVNDWPWDPTGGPLQANRHHPTLYVDPRTGILRRLEGPYPERQEWKQNHTAAEAFLVKNLGKPWTTVAVAALRNGLSLQALRRVGLRTDVRVENGIPCGKTWGRKRRPLREGSFYVALEEGILRRFGEPI